MSFPKAPVRSLAWYDNCFEGASPSMPSDLRRFSESVCNRFSISGICDPMYIANVTAFEMGKGDGCSNFHAMDAEARERFTVNLDRVVERLAFSYSSCIQGAKQQLRELALAAFVPQESARC
jgi:hypothetical protein